MVYDNQLGWLWSGKEYFDISVDEKSHLYSESESNWLFLNIPMDKESSGLMRMKFGSLPTVKYLKFYKYILKILN